MLNPTGSIDQGMLGEYVDIYEPEEHKKVTVDVQIQEVGRLQSNNKTSNVTSSIQTVQTSVPDQPAVSPTPPAPTISPSLGYIENNLNNQVYFAQTPSTAQLISQSSLQQPVYQAIQVPQQQYYNGYQQNYAQPMRQQAIVSQPIQQNPNIIQYVQAQPQYLQQQPNLGYNNYGYIGQGYPQQGVYAPQTTSYVQQPINYQAANYIGMGLGQVPTLVYT